MDDRRFYHRARGGGSDCAGAARPLGPAANSFDHIWAWGGGGMRGACGSGALRPAPSQLHLWSLLRPCAGPIRAFRPFEPPLCGPLGAPAGRHAGAASGDGGAPPPLRRRPAPRAGAGAGGERALWQRGARGEPGGRGHRAGVAPGRRRAGERVGWRRRRHCAGRRLCVRLRCVCAPLAGSGPAAAAAAASEAVSAPSARRAAAERGGAGGGRAWV